MTDGPMSGSRLLGREARSISTAAHRGRGARGRAETGKTSALAETAGLGVLSCATPQCRELGCQSEAVWSASFRMDLQVTRSGLPGCVSRAWGGKEPARHSMRRQLLKQGITTLHQVTTMVFS